MDKRTLVAELRSIAAATADPSTVVRLLKVVQVLEGKRRGL